MEGPGPLTAGLSITTAQSYVLGTCSPGPINALNPLKLHDGLTGGRVCAFVKASPQS